MKGRTPTPEHVNETINEIADPQPVATKADIRKALKDSLRYIKNDTLVADPSAILGRVYYEKEGSDELHQFPSSIDAPVSADSKLSAPQTVSELIIDTKAKLGVEALALISAQISGGELLEVRVINNATARLADRGDAWEAAVEKWSEMKRTQQLMSDPTVKTISVVTGVVQKYLTVKKYKKFEATAKGGSFGVNVDGNLYTSTSQFELEVIYGIDLVLFKNEKGPENVVRNIVEGAELKTPSARAAVSQKFVALAASGEPLVPLAPDRSPGRKKAHAPKGSKPAKKPGKPHSS
jgi:hypothetical protein